MNYEVQEILQQYVEEIGGAKYFMGDEKSENAFNATIVIAESCPSYVLDQEEEIQIPGTRTCYNCRYRRWAQDAFNCYNGFPVRQ